MSLENGSRLLVVQFHGVRNERTADALEALPAILAGELRLVTALVGRTIEVIGPLDDFLLPDFAPYGVPLSARLAKAARHAAVRLTGSPLERLAASLARRLQERGAEALARGFALDIVLLDRTGGSGGSRESGVIREGGGAEEHLTIAFLAGGRSNGASGRDTSIDVDEMTSGEIAVRVLEQVRARAPERAADRGGRGELSAPTSAIAGTRGWWRLVHGRYLFEYLPKNWFRGAWREPIFFCSSLGRLLRREGYSASMLRAIYDQGVTQYGLLDRVFLGYGPHRDVYERIGNLLWLLEPELERRLADGRELRLLTAPSGFSYDLFGPLERLATRMPEAMRLVRVLAADLDAQGVIAPELRRRATALGIQFEFHKGDLRDEALRTVFRDRGPYDIVLFVGFSNWFMLPELLEHLRLLPQLARQDGTVITDCLAPGFFVFPSWNVGFRAHFYTPRVYRTLLDYCGLDESVASITSGSHGVDHIVRTVPKRLAWPPGPGP